MRFELDRHGIAQLLTSEGVQSDLMRRGEAVADAARQRGVMVDGEPGDEALPIVVFNATSSTRARVLVVSDHAAGLAVESRDRLLVSSLGAAG